MPGFAFGGFFELRLLTNRLFYHCTYETFCKGTARKQKLPHMNLLMSTSCWMNGIEE